MADLAPFVGRKAELAELDAALTLARDGHGSFVLIAGEPGIGKTSLCTCFSERARRRGTRVLWGRAWEWGGAPPFWPWVQVFRTLEGSADAQPQGLEPLFAEAAAGGRFTLFDRATERLRARADDEPLLVVLEDLHAADVPTLLLLRFAIEQLRDARVLVLGTWRTVESSPSPEARALIGEVSRAAQSLDLSGLGSEEIAELVRADRGDARLDSAAALHDRTGGNPLLLTALLRSGARALSDEALPNRARAAIERRIARLDPAALAVLSAASVIGREMAVLLLVKVCARPLDDVLEQVRVLSQERILVERPSAPGRYGFCHGLFREVVYAALSPGERLRLHRAAGQALEELYGAERQLHLSELARHFLAVSPDLERGVEYAAGAGEQALRSLAYEEAANHFGRAIAALESSATASARLAPLWLRLGDAQAASGARASAEDSYRRARQLASDGGDEPLKARVALAFARVVGFGRADEESIEWLEQALAQVTEPAVRVRLLGALIDRLWVFPGAAARLDGLTREALELARSTGDPRLIAETLAAALVIVWFPDARRFLDYRAYADELFSIAEELADPELRVEACRWHFTVAMISGAVDRAKRVLDAYERLADRLLRPQLRFNALLRRVMLARLEGRFEEGERLLAAAERAGRRAGDAQAGYLLAGFRYEGHRLQHRVAEMERAREDFARIVGSDLPHVVMLATNARCLAQIARLEDARRELDEYFAVAPGHLSGGGPIGLANATWALWWLGDADLARAILSLLAPAEGLTLMGGAVQFLGPASLFLGLATATAGDPQRAVPHLEAAIAALDGMGARPMAAEARHALGLVLRESEPSRSALLCARAAETCRALGGPALIEPHAGPFSRAGNRHAGSGRSASAGEGLFAAEGDYYAVGLDGRVTRVRSSKGLSYIARLLRSEGTELHVLDLAGSALEDRGPDVPLLDERAKAAYRERAATLRAELDEAERFADAGRSERARHELEALLAELARGTGLSGRDRATGTAERARASVTLAIRRAVRGLKTAEPALAAHFATSIATGTFCVYRPEPRARIAWRFEPPVAS